MVKLKPNKSRAETAIIFLWISIGTMVIAIAAQINHLIYLNELKSSGLIDMPGMGVEMGVSDGLVALSSVLFGLMFIGSWIAFLAWYRRAYFNLHTLTDGLKMTEGWAVGAWFVPIYSLWGPYSIGKDLFKHSERILVERGVVLPKKSRKKTVGLWWTFWLVSLVISSAKSFMDPSKSDVTAIDDFINYNYAGLISGALIIVAGIFAIRMVKQYREMESLLNVQADVSGSYSGDSDLLDSDL